MSRISGLLAQILSSVYGRDVRQSIHDAISQCYADVASAKTIADDAVSDMETSVSGALNQVNTTISSAETRVNAAVASCNASVTAANEAAQNANEKANAANTAATNVQNAFADLGFVVQNGKLCVRVERS